MSEEIIRINLWTVKTVTVCGTGTNLTFHDSIIPKLAPPPPLIAQKRSSPIDSLSRILPSASTICASITLSAPKPYFLIIGPYAPPVMKTQTRFLLYQCWNTLGPHPRRKSMDFAIFPNFVIKFA
ncbi:hypothetical protein ACJIZ3_013420 [Penstemon smallii]|uniref:Uncharacterized protein n=1 Tax=Penstemon smallii TaxID=265156 RepID=A0ABD3UTR7_9LAMI